MREQGAGSRAATDHHAGSDGSPSTALETPSSVASSQLGGCGEVELGAAYRWGARHQTGLPAQSCAQLFCAHGRTQFHITIFLDDVSEFDDDQTCEVIGELTHVRRDAEHWRGVVSTHPTSSEDDCQFLVSYDENGLRVEEPRIGCRASFCRLGTVLESWPIVFDVQTIYSTPSSALCDDCFDCPTVLTQEGLASRQYWTPVPRYEEGFM